MVEIDVRVGPWIIKILHLQALGLIGHYSRVDRHTQRINADSISTPKKVDPHDAEDKPKYQADQKYVADSWYGLNQGIHYHLDNY